MPYLGAGGGTGVDLKRAITRLSSLREDISIRLLSRPRSCRRRAAFPTFLLLRVNNWLAENFLGGTDGGP